MAIPYGRFIIGPISWYGFLITLGIALAFWVASRQETRIGLPRDTMVDVTLVAVPCGIIGARLYYVVMNWEPFAANPLSVFAIWEGGVAIYGAVIGGAIGVFIFCLVKKIAFADILDIVAPGLLLAQAVGRWGNYFNMEAYGDVIAEPLLQFFPLGVLIPENGEMTWRMATFFYESLWNFCGFLLLLQLRKRPGKRGNVFLWYLIIYGSGRFIIESLRADSLWLGEYRVSQGLSLLLCVFAASMLLWRTPQRKFSYLIPAMMGAIVAVERWCFLSEWGYLVMLLVAVLFAIYCWRRVNGAKVRLSELLIWVALDACVALLTLFRLEVTAFLPAAIRTAVGTMLPHVHAVLSSVTLIGYVHWLVRVFSSAEAGGESECP